MTPRDSALRQGGPETLLPLRRAAGSPTRGRFPAARSRPARQATQSFSPRRHRAQSEGTPIEGDCQQGYTIDPATNRLNNATHDAAGNVTVLGFHTYSYDALNMQIRDVSPSGAREYVYTADDERIAVYEDGQRWRWTVATRSA